MATSVPTPDVLLRTCADAGPAPWFPSRYAAEMGVDRDSLDVPLNELRLAGLVQIAGWEPGKGQCYVVTDSGRALLANANGMAQLKSGMALAVAVQPKVPTRPTRGTTWDRGEAARDAFLTSRPAPVVYALAISQVLVFIVGMSEVMRHNAQLSQYFSTGTYGQPPRPPFLTWYLWRPAIESGRWWQLISSAFVHFGLLHLLMNVYGLATLGPIVERMYGSIRFLIMYLLSALGGSVAALLLGTENSLTGGSSGALCGLIGGFASFVLLNRRHLGHQLFDHSQRWLGNTIVLLVLFSLMPRVSWQAHLGGFLAGLISGLLLTYQRFGTTEQRWAALLGLVILPVAMLAPLFERGILHWPKQDHRVAAVKIGMNLPMALPGNLKRLQRRRKPKLARQNQPESV